MSGQREATEAETAAPDPRVPGVLHRVAAKLQAKADAELAQAQRRYEISCKVINDTEQAALRAEAAIVAAASVRAALLGES